MEDYARLPIEDRLRRLEQTPEDLAPVIGRHSDAELSRRPDGKNWSPKEIVCHLRDVEELFLTRFLTILAVDEPKILAVNAAPQDLAQWGIGGPVGHPLDPDRWAEERQYHRNDTGEALGAFHRRRKEVLALLGGLSAEQWQRGGIHPTRGRMTIADIAAALAGHDDNHLEQFSRALEGRA